MVRMRPRRPHRELLPSPARRTATVAALALLLVAGLPPGTGRGAVPGTNGDLVFREVQGGDSELYRIGADGSSTRDISRAPNAQDLDPAWSPNGALIAYARKATGAQLPPDIWVMFSDGAGRTRLTDDSVPERQPAWSPDGSHIAYARAGGNFGGYHIWAMNAGGTFQHEVTSPWAKASDTDPAWSPDGTRIAFVRSKPGAFPELYVVNADGSGLQRLTMNDWIEGHPTWSPDGTRIAFDRCCLDGQSDLYTIDVATRIETNLTNSPTMDEFEPAWSPDGTMIAFTAFVLGDGNKDLYEMALDGTGTVTRLTSDPAAELAPDWQPRLACTITGTWRKDTLIGTPGNDVICGNGGADTIAGGGGNDLIYGGGGSDQIDAGDGDDVVFGGGGYDRITGGPGFDWIDGGLKNDTCSTDEDGGVTTSCETVLPG
jgi:Tol biopolymer transport system component